MQQLQSVLYCTGMFTNQTEAGDERALNVFKMWVNKTFQVERALGSTAVIFCHHFIFLRSQFDVTNLNISVLKRIYCNIFSSRTTDQSILNK